jgi:hypothetical protein
MSVHAGDTDGGERLDRTAAVSEVPVAIRFAAPAEAAASVAGGRQFPHPYSGIENTTGAGTMRFRVKYSTGVTRDGGSLISIERLR